MQSTIGLHSIFQKSSFSKKNAARFCCSANDGDRIVIYQEDSIRWCYSTIENKFETLALDPPMPNIINMLMDSTGKYICIYDNKEVRVVEIPWGLWNLSNDLSCKFRRDLQRRRYEFDPRLANIKQVLFHPMTAESPCIVCLLSNDEIATIDVEGNLDLSTVTASSYSNKQTNGIFGLSSRLENIQSIAFGKNGLSLFAVTESDVYCFYPFLAPVMTVEKSQIDELLAKSIVLYENEKASTDIAVKKCVIKQLEFAFQLRSRILDQINSGHDSQNKKFQLKISEAFRQVQAQGYFTISSFPSQLYACSIKEVKSLPISESEDLIILAFDNGTIAILYLQNELTMSWDTPSYSYNNSFTLLEIINLAKEEVNSLTMLENQVGKFVTLGEKNMNIIDTTEWSSIIATSIRNNDLRPMENIRIKSAINKVASTDKITSSISWKSSKGNDKLVSITDKDIIITSHTIDGQEPVHTKLLTNNEFSIKKTKITFNKPISDLLTMNQKLQSSFQNMINTPIPADLRNQPFANEDNEKQLAILTTVAESFGEKLLQAQSIGWSIHERIIESQDVLAEQLLLTRKLVTKKSELLKAYEDQKIRFDDQHVKLTELEARLKKLNESVEKIKEGNQYKSVDISPKELEFFKEVKSQVLLFNEMVKKQKQQHESIKYLKKNLDHIIQIQTNTQRNASEWSEFQNLLKLDADVIDKCSTEISKTLSYLKNEGTTA